MYTQRYSRAQPDGEAFYHLWGRSESFRERMIDRAVEFGTEMKSTESVHALRQLQLEHFEALANAASEKDGVFHVTPCLLYTSPSPRDS